MLILLTGGGTAGHVMPHVALMPYIRRYFTDVAYVGSRDSVEERLALAYSIPFYPVTTVKLDRSRPYRNLAIPTRLARGILEAGRILDRLKPDVIFAKGGYVSLPVGLSARRRHVPLAIHESDYTMGLANKLLKPRADRIYTAFEDTAKAHGGVRVGIPLRQELYTAKGDSLRREIGHDGSPILLVTGGSLGASAINDGIYRLLPSLVKRYHVVHLTGRGKAIPYVHPRYTQMEYTDKMGEYLAASDLVVSRAGANTAFELMSLKKRTVFVPLSRGSRGDQVHNARYFTRFGAKMLEEEELVPHLEETLDSLLRSPPPSIDLRCDCDALARDLRALAISKATIR